MNFCTADDMSAILSIKLRNRLGFGMWARMHMTGIHVEGKVYNLYFVFHDQNWYRNAGSTTLLRVVHNMCESYLNRVNTA
jgi:hypothetical protein